jgi:hypothetical protein
MGLVKACRHEIVRLEAGIRNECFIVWWSHQVEVEVVCLEVVEGLENLPPNRRRALKYLVGPYLGGEEEILPSNAAVLDREPDLGCPGFKSLRVEGSRVLVSGRGT